MELRHVTLLEVNEILGQLNNTTTMGHDLLDPLTLKLVVGTVTRPIQHILNCSIDTQTYCTKWKLGKLLLLLKHGDDGRLSKKSYRLISILPIISKIMEKAIQSQVLKFMNDTGQFNKNLHAYRSLHSMTTAALQLSDFMMEAADQGLIANAMMIDQSSAFSCVGTSILDGKLELYKLSEKTRRWFMSFLEFISQYVCVGAARSTIRTMNTGVPQGSVLGPILYSLYINKLPELAKNNDCSELCHNDSNDLFGKNCSRCGIMPCYEDNCTIVASRTQEENITKLRGKLTVMTEFLQSNNLCINQTKTKTQDFMVKQKRVRFNENPTILLIETEDGEKEIKKLMHSRLLGLNLHRDLNWRSHLELGPTPLLPTLRRRLGAIRHLGQSVPKRARQILING